MGGDVISFSAFAFVHLSRLIRFRSISPSSSLVLSLNFIFRRFMKLLTFKLPEKVDKIWFLAGDAIGIGSESERLLKPFPDCIFIFSGKRGQFD